MPVGSIAAARRRSSSTPLVIGPYGGSWNSNSLYAANFMFGRAYVSNFTGSVDKIGIVGSTAHSSSDSYRLCVYEATDANTWGILLGQSDILTSLGMNEVKEVDLQSPVAVTAGSYYAICIHSSSNNIFCSNIATTGGRFVVDTFADGPRSPQNATTDNGPRPIAWLRSGTAVLGERVPRGDMQGGSDRRKLAGDMQTGSDIRKTRETT